MRGLVIGVLLAALSAAAAFAAPERSAAFHGWRYGPITGNVTLTTTSPALACTPDADSSERRVVSGSYRATFSGTSMRSFRPAADIDFNLAAGGPAGNTEPIALRVRRSAQETVHVRTVTEDAEGNLHCSLAEQRCAKTETKTFRRASNRLNVQMLRGARVRIIPSLPGAGGVVLVTCTPNLGDPATLWPDVAFARTFPLGVFTRPRSIIRFAWSGKRRGRTEAGVPVEGQLVYRSSVAVRRLPGTPPARCRVC
jgi:hypothetical protein